MFQSQLEKNGTYVPQSAWSVHPQVADCLPPKPVSDSQTCPIPFSRENFKTQAPDLCEEQEGGLGPSGRPVLEATLSGLPRTQGRQCIPARQGGSGSLPQQAGRKHTLTECPIRAGTFGLVSFYSLRQIHFVLWGWNYHPYFTEEKTEAQEEPSAIP